MPRHRQAFNPFLESLVACRRPTFLQGWQWVGLQIWPVHIGVKASFLLGQPARLCGLLDHGTACMDHMPWPFLGGLPWEEPCGDFVPGFLKAKSGGHEVINTSCELDSFA